MGCGLSKSQLRSTPPSSTLGQAVHNTEDESDVVSYGIIASNGNFIGLLAVRRQFPLERLEQCSYRSTRRAGEASGEAFANHDKYDVIIDDAITLGVLLLDPAFSPLDLANCEFALIRRASEVDDQELQNPDSFRLPENVFKEWSDPELGSSEISASTGGNKMCEECHGLRLAKEEFDATDENQDRKLFVRNLQSMREIASYCNLCSLVVYAVDDSRSSWEPTEHVTDGAVECTAWLQWYRFPSTKSIRVIDISTNFPFHGPSYGIQLLPMQAPEHHFLGRLIDSNSIQPTLVRKWIDRCHAKHVKRRCTIEKSPRFKDISNILTCIDVENHQLVQPTGQFNYVALSYVWAKRETPVLTSDRLATWMSPGGMTSIISQLPATIQDAIDLTARIGERFLWVDALCIVQDDQDLKMKLINKMDLVYENALLTILAASGENADAGLPGVRNNSRAFEQRIAQVNTNLSMTYPITHSTLINSKWASRGWTYQEYFFSKRRLIFHNGLMFFKCNSETWREDMALESFGGTIDQFDLSRGFNAATELWEPPIRISGGIDARLNYQSWVCTYMSRQLSYDTDGLNAFAGIANWSESEMGYSTHFGMNNVTFSLDLVWQPERFMSRRHQFPSWSWAGWKGRIMPQFSDMKEVGREYYFSRWLVCYKWDSDLGLSRVCDYEDEESWDLGYSSFQVNHNDTLKTPLYALAAARKRLRKEHKKETDYGTNAEIQAALFQLRMITKISNERFTELALALVRAPQPLSSLIMFKTIVVDLWVSALAPDNTIPDVVDTNRTYGSVKLRPALYLYSTVGPKFENVGLAWMNAEATYFEIRDSTIQTAEGLQQPKERDKACWPVLAISRARDDRPDEEAMPRDMKAQLDMIGTEPDGTEDSLPLDPVQRHKVQSARQICKVTVAFISGPVAGHMQTRVGVPKSYPYTSHRGFFRVLILSKPPEAQVSTYPMFGGFFQRIGTGELELFAIEKLPDLMTKEVFMI